MYIAHTHEPNLTLRVRLLPTVANVL